MISLPVLLPNGFTPLISPGDAVTTGQALAQKNTKDEQVINIVEQLSIPLGKVKHVLKKNPGDDIKAGDIIAIKKGFLGLDQHMIKSRVDGTIARYERDTGNLIIRTAVAATSEQIVSPVDGIISLCDNEKIVINTDKNVAVGKKGSGTREEGEVFILKASFTSDASDVLYHLDNSAIGKIVVGGKLSREILVKGIGMGTLGMIGTDIAQEDIEHLISKNHKIPVLEVDEATIKRLTEWNGKKIILEGESKSIIFLQKNI